MIDWDNAQENQREKQGDEGWLEGGGEEERSTWH